MHPKQVSDQYPRIGNYTYEKSKLPNLVLFVLPSNHAIFAKERLVQHDSIKQLLARADFYLTKQPLSIMEKNQTLPGGDKHDFVSLSPYYWPDPSKPNGFPYIYRDSEINPEVRLFPDGQNMHEMIKRVKILSVAYYFTNNITYASKATELLRVWFLNKNTHMNPNLRHSEVRPGIDDGSPGGVISGIYFRDILDAIRLIQDSKAWTKQDQQGITQWFKSYLHWLLSSDFGKEERRELNNHGTWFDVQASSIALFLNETDIAKEILQNNIDNLIATKIEPQGPQPYELHRRASLDYHIFNLLGFFNLAKIGDKIGDDLWDYKSPLGSGLQSELDYVLPFALGKEKWPYEQIKPVDRNKLLDLLCQATIHYEDKETYKQAYKSTYRHDETKAIDELIYGCVGT